MKVLKNKKFRAGMFLTGFIGILAAAICAIAVAYSVGMGVTDRTQPFPETDYIKDSLRSGMYTAAHSAHNSYVYSSMKLNEKEIEFKDYDSGKTKKVTLGEFLEGADLSDIARNVRDGSCLNYSEPYDGSLYSGTSESFIRLRFSDYLDIIKKKGVRYEGVDPELPEDTDRISDISEYIPIDEDTYIVGQNGSYLAFSLRGEYIFRTGLYKPNGYQYVSGVADYVYVASPEEKLDKDELDDYILGQVLLCSKEIVAYEALTAEEKNAACAAADSEGYFGNAGNVSAVYSIDGRKVTVAKLYSDMALSGDAEGYDNYDFREIRERILLESDAYIMYNPESKNTVQCYRDKDGKMVSFNYISSSDLADVRNIADGGFVVGLKIYGTSSDAAFCSYLHELNSLIPESGLLMIAGLLIFIASEVLLIAGTEGRLIWVDRAPFILQLTVIAGFTFAVYFNLKTIGSFSVFANILTNGLWLLIVVGIVMAAAMYAVCDSFILSITRRIKAHDLAGGFISVNLYRWLKERLKETFIRLKGRTRLLIAVISFLVVKLVSSLIALAVYGDDFLFLLLIIMAALDIAGIIILIKYMTDTDELLKATHRIESGDLNAKADVSKLYFNNKELGISINNLGTGLSNAVEASVRDERTKAELITNVSHDIKTPLTSIINYVDLLKREEIDNPKAKEYIEVIDQKAERLKQLILDLIEASKTGTGNIELERMPLDLVELIRQATGEYEEKFEESSLEMIENIGVDRAVIFADGRRVFRIIDNLLNNVSKYAMPGTRVYLDLKTNEDAEGNFVELSIKNISKEMLNISSEELMERFVRGDKSRSTEGSGLGLSIARNLTELQDGIFTVEIKGDLFEVKVAFPLNENNRDGRGVM